ncbi:MAG: hypothetical protein KKB03_04575 [Nanoarchaeota archaeon]|nr:hypothetical protein [Nanoarchaeota archaeon]MBU1135761.1 hypothetical protein [Nanoarchaeota archaeon]MBU2520488.1 hypothetical protein [Nanoarchaeota archaeon]
MYGNIIRGVVRTVAVGLALGYVFFSPNSEEIGKINRVNIPDCAGNPYASVVTDDDNSLQCEVSVHDEIYFNGNKIQRDLIPLYLNSLDENEKIDWEINEFIKYEITVHDEAFSNKLTSDLDVFCGSLIDDPEERLDSCVERVRNGYGLITGTKSNYFEEMIKTNKGGRDVEYKIIDFDDDTAVCIENWVKKYMSFEYGNNKIIFDIDLTSKSGTKTAGEIIEYYNENNEID